MRQPLPRYLFTLICVLALSSESFMAHAGAKEKVPSEKERRDGEELCVCWGGGWRLLCATLQPLPFYGRKRAVCLPFY